jgi:hypothetical protein
VAQNGSVAIFLTAILFGAKCNRSRVAPNQST